MALGMMKQIVMFSPDGGMGSAFKMAGDLDGGETPKENDCPNCGAELVSGAAFCGECGKTTEKETGSGEKWKICPSLLFIRHLM